MTEEERLEKAAAITRRRMLEIRGGNAQEADEFICFIMRYLKEAYARMPPNEQNPAMEAKILCIIGMLIQR